MDLFPRSCYVRYRPVPFLRTSRGYRTFLCRHFTVRIPGHTLITMLQISRTLRSHHGRYIPVPRILRDATGCHWRVGFSTVTIAHFATVTHTHASCRTPLPTSCADVTYRFAATTPLPLHRTFVVYVYAWCYVRAHTHVAVDLIHSP